MTHGAWLHQYIGAGLQFFILLYIPLSLYLHSLSYLRLLISPFPSLSPSLSSSPSSLPSLSSSISLQWKLIQKGETPQTIRCVRPLHWDIVYILILLHLAEREMHWIQNDDKTKRQKNIDCHGPSPIANICHLPAPPSFSLQTTFKTDCNYKECLAFLYRRGALVGGRLWRNRKRHPWTVVLIFSIRVRKVNRGDILSRQKPTAILHRV